MEELLLILTANPIQSVPEEADVQGKLQALLALLLGQRLPHLGLAGLQCAEQLVQQPGPPAPVHPQASPQGGSINSNGRRRFSICSSICSSICCCSSSTCTRGPPFFGLCLFMKRTARIHNFLPLIYKVVGCIQQQLLHLQISFGKETQLLHVGCHGLLIIVHQEIRRHCEYPEIEISTTQSLDKTAALRTCMHEYIHTRALQTHTCIHACMC